MDSLFRTPAISGIKTSLKLAEIQLVAPEVVDLRTELSYYVDVKERLDESENQKLKWLLAETFEAEQFGTRSFLEVGGKVIEVGPRLGLVTPWSTSAGTVLRACNLFKVNRIEVARRYCLIIENGKTINGDQTGRIVHLLHDKMTEQIYSSPLTTFDSGITPEVVEIIPLIEEGMPALHEFAKKRGLGFTSAMANYIYNYFFNELKRNPTDVELFMFGQLNSEHCRHHIFNGVWAIDNVVQNQTLMQMIRETVKVSPGNLAVAFKDNAAVLSPVLTRALIPTRPDIASGFTVVTIRRGFVLKIETHNHPTTVSPYQGAATGVAVRRDVFGTGRGGVSIGHMAGYYVGNLLIPDYIQPWEKIYIPYSPRFAEPLKILIEASNGASDNCNCFGNPVTFGTTRSFEQMIGLLEKVHFGYRKTAMVAGSFGHIDERHVQKCNPQKGMLVVQTGGLSFPIGVGGGSGSSKDAGGQVLELDFNSVQRDDAFTERGNFNVVRACSELGDKNPIVTLTDLGAGGDCVAIPELVHPLGARIELRNVPCGDKSMATWVFWCNESQERMAYLVWKDDLPLFEKICERNRCTMAVIGEVTGDGQFVLSDSQAEPAALEEKKVPINVGMNWLLADLPQREINCTIISRILEKPSVPNISVIQHLNRLFKLADVGSKEFLTRKADRTVGNRSVRQQEVGPMLLPIANCAVMSDGPFGKTGNVIALGEQPIVGLVNNEAGVRMSIGEALTNAVWALIKNLSDLNFSATWQWPCGQPGEDALLYQAVRAAKKCLIDLYTRIGVGKDSLSMTLKEIESEGKVHPILAPGTVQMVAFGPCHDINNVITPDIKMPGKSKLMFVDLAKGKQRLGGSAFLRVYEQIGDEAPDFEDFPFFIQVWNAMQKLIQRSLILSGHDKSDGGLIGCVSEMAFAGNCGLKLDLRGSRLGGNDRDKLLFNQELGLIFEFLPENYDAIRGILRRAGVSEHCHVIGQTTESDSISVLYNGQIVLRERMSDLRVIWRETSFQLDKLQANPATVEAEKRNTKFNLSPEYFLSFKPRPTPKSVMIKTKKPKAAILREAGINGDRDAAETLYLAGFNPWDVHMNDLISGETRLNDFQFLFLPGGFSFRDSMDAGKGAGGVFKFNKRAVEELTAFVDRSDTLMFGPCNGCQEMALLGILPWSGIPTEKLPRFIKNESERFEHRQIAVKIVYEGNSVFFKGMQGSILGIIISHGQGRFHCTDEGTLKRLNDLTPVRYVDPYGNVTGQYPFNPNGSPAGIAGISSLNGRFLAMMPHPERLPLNNLWPWQPREWKKLKASPWLKMFQNAREWCEQA
jgi:phosphoribosylformylglycinamidine synthase